MKYINLNGADFEVHTSRMYPVAPITGCNRAEIFQCYGRPSNVKVSIWNDWCDWCEEMNKDGWKCGIEIASHNINFFTIAGSLRNDDETYDLYITASHNKIFKHFPI